MIVIFGYACAATILAYVCLLSATKLRLPDVLPSIELMGKIAKNRVILSEIRQNLIPAEKIVEDFLAGDSKVDSEVPMMILSCVYE